MRIGKYNDFAIRLTDKQWSRLKKRFNPERLYELSRNAYCIEGYCICGTVPWKTNQEMRCPKCPLNYNPNYYASCADIAREVMESRSINLSNDIVIVYASSMAKAKAIVSKMDKFLDSFTIEQE